MPRWYEAANESAFKRVEGGYVFQAPNPWILAWPRYYLVNEAQKTEIAARLGRWRILLLTLLVITMLIVFSFLLFMIWSPATYARLVRPMVQQWGAATFSVAIGFLMILLMAPMVVVPQVYLARALRPLLANTPRTSERIKFREQLRTTATSVSGKLLVAGLVAGVVLVGTGVFLLLDAFLEGRFVVSSWLALVAGGLLIAYFGYLIRLKAKLKREAELRRG